MPPRRSSRAPSSKAAGVPSSPAKAPPKSKTASNVRTKRAASTERPADAPVKRSRGGSTQPGKTDENAELLPDSKPAVNGHAQKPASTRSQANGHIARGRPRKQGLTPVPESVPQAVPYFNPLPIAPEHLRPAGQLFAWGAGNFGQFGMGSSHLGEFEKPKRNMWIEEKMEDGTFGGEDAGIETVVAGGLHTLFIDEKGTVWSCGVNDEGALGRLTKDVPDPKNPGKSLDIDELTSLPHPLQTLVDEGFRAVKVTAGDNISAAISDKGEFRIWGSFRGVEGSLGFADGKKHQFLPVSLLHLPRKAGDIEKVSSCTAGSNHILVLTTHGNIYAWGAGEQGQLGHKVLERRKIGGTVPYKLVLGALGDRRRAVLVGAGNYHSFAVDEKGDVWGWGLNTLGQTGTGLHSEGDTEIPTPRLVLGLSQEELGGEKIVQIAGGEHHTLFLTSGGKVYACGRHDRGQLGLAKDHPVFEGKEGKDAQLVTVPTLVPFPDDDDPVVQISAGTHNSAAVTKGGALYAFGGGEQGELGTGAEGDARTPTVVVRKTGGSWAAVSVACGGQHTLGLFRKKT